MHRKRLGPAFVINNVSDSMPQTRVDFQALIKSFRTVGFDINPHENCAQKVSFVQFLKCYVLRYFKGNSELVYQWKCRFRMASTHWNNYRPHPKDGESNVFTPVCLRGGGGGEV